MDLIVFDRDLPVADRRGLLLRNARIVTGWTSLSWIEKYSTLSEFQVSGPLSSGLRDMLPKGAFVAQVNSGEVMMVEDHQMRTSKDKEPEITVSGRSVDLIFLYRIIGARFTTHDTQYPEEDGDAYMRGDIAPWSQARLLMEQFSGPQVTSPGSGGVRSPNSGDHIEHMRIVVSVKPGTGSEYESEPRQLRYGPVYSAVSEMLGAFNGGLRTIRSNWGHSLSNVSESDKTTILIHNGRNRSDSVGFSHARGEVDSADYLWSNRNYVNRVVVFPSDDSPRKWRVFVTEAGITGMERRSASLDASDIDAGQSLVTSHAMPQMLARGRDHLAQRKELEISNIAIAPNSGRFRYRKDYDIGDLIGFEGEFGGPAVKQVVEFAEFEDENGYVSFPTLANPDKIF